MRFLANLKCNHTRASFKEYAQILDANLSANDDVTVFPPFSALDLAAHKFKLGAQNFYPCESGAHTGEIGKAMLDEFGVKSVLIGHSERRELGESEELLRAKFDFAAKAGWQIVYCIGENLSVNEAGGTKEFLAEQLKNIDLGYERLLIAYEPVWAIGTGRSAGAEQIEEILNQKLRWGIGRYGELGRVEVFRAYTRCLASLYFVVLKFCSVIICMVTPVAKF